MPTPPDRRAPRAALALAAALLLAALGAGAWLRALAPGPGGDPAAPVAARAPAPAAETAAPPAVGAALGTAAAPGGAALTTVEGVPRAVEIVLPGDVCAEGLPVSVAQWVVRRAGGLAAVGAPRVAVRPGPGCVVQQPLDGAALAADRLTLLEVCAWGGPRPRCAALHLSRWDPGDPLPGDAVAVGDRWRWAAALEADEARGTGCGVGAPGEIGGQELQQVQLAVAGRYTHFDLAEGGLRADLGCALARLGHGLDTPSVGYGRTELAGLLVQ